MDGKKKLCIALLISVIAICIAVMFLLFCLYKTDLADINSEESSGFNSEVYTTKDIPSNINEYVNNEFDVSELSNNIPYEEDKVISDACEILFNGSPINKYNTILRWKDTIKVKLTGKYTDKEKEIVTVLINKFNTIDNFPNIHLAAKSETANLIIAFGTNEYLSSHYINIPSYGFKYKCTLSGNDKYIKQAYLKIAKLDDVVLYNKRITRAFLEALGVGRYNSEIYKISDSVFNPNVRTHYLTAFDRSMIEVLYSKGFTVGKYKDTMKEYVEDYYKKNYSFVLPTTQPTTQLITGSPPVY